MKATFVLVGLLAAFGATFAKPNGVEVDTVAYQQRAFEGMVEDIIDSVREIVGPYDPFHAEEIQQSIAGHDALVKNVNAEGFSNFFASHISLGGLMTWTLDLVLEAPKVISSVENWKVDGGVFYGDGAANSVVEDFKIALVAKINVFSMTLKSLKVTPSIGKADVSITGIYNDEQKSQEISDRINHFLNDTLNNDKDLHDRISAILFNVVDKILKSMF